MSTRRSDRIKLKSRKLQQLEVWQEAEWMNMIKPNNPCKRTRKKVGRKRLHGEDCLDEAITPPRPKKSKTKAIGPKMWSRVVKKCAVNVQELPDDVVKNHLQDYYNVYVNNTNVSTIATTTVNTGTQNSNDSSAVIPVSLSNVDDDHMLAKVSNNVFETTSEGDSANLGIEDPKDDLSYTLSMMNEDYEIDFMNLEFESASITDNATTFLPIQDKNNPMDITELSDTYFNAACDDIGELCYIQKKNMATTKINLGVDKVASADVGTYAYTGLATTEKPVDQKPDTFNDLECSLKRLTDLEIAFDKLMHQSSDEEFDTTTDTGQDKPSSNDDDTEIENIYSYCKQPLLLKPDRENVRTPAAVFGYSDESPETVSHGAKMQIAEDSFLVLTMSDNDDTMDQTSSNRVAKASAADNTQDDVKPPVEEINLLDYCGDNKNRRMNARRSSNRLAKASAAANTQDDVKPPIAEITLCDYCDGDNRRTDADDSPTSVEDTTSEESSYISAVQSTINLVKSTVMVRGSDFEKLFENDQSAPPFKTPEYYTPLAERLRMSIPRTQLLDEPCGIDFYKVAPHLSSRPDFHGLCAEFLSWRSSMRSQPSKANVVTDYQLLGEEMAEWLQQTHFGRSIRYQCTFCNQLFLTPLGSEELHVRLGLWQGKRHKCTRCAVYCDTPEKLFDHERRTHPWLGRPWFVPRWRRKKD